MIVRVVATAVLGLMLDTVTVSTVLANKDRSDPISQKIEQERRTLEKLKDEIQEKKKQADDATKQKESVLQAIQELDGRQVSSRGRSGDDLANPQARHGSPGRWPVREARARGPCPWPVQAAGAG